VLTVLEQARDFNERYEEKAQKQGSPGIKNNPAKAGLFFMPESGRFRTENRRS
jgi:hypothetical protein